LSGDHAGADNPILRSSSTMQLRHATPADLATLTCWDRQPHVVVAGGGTVDWPRELGRGADWQEILIGEVDGRPVGVIQIIDPAREESHYWGAVARDLRAIDIWIGEAADLGKGYGTAMMRLALERCFAVPEVTAVVVDPLANNAGAIRFYERLGFRLVERRRLGPDDCCVYRLTRKDWLEQAHADAPGDWSAVNRSPGRNSAGNRSDP
jgi:aminoglycoside 6'-N-acetyltransferase